MLRQELVGMAQTLNTCPVDSTITKASKQDMSVVSRVITLPRYARLVSDTGCVIRRQDITSDKIRKRDSWLKSIPL